MDKMLQQGIKLCFAVLYIVITFVSSHYFFATAVFLDNWVDVHIDFRPLPDIRRLINLDQQIWNFMFALFFPFSRKVLEASLMEARETNLVMTVTLIFCFLLNFLGLQLN
jgi:hypothetical protein